MLKQVRSESSEPGGVSVTHTVSLRLHSGGTYELTRESNNAFNGSKRQLVDAINLFLKMGDGSVKERPGLVDALPPVPPQVSSRY